jgi:hypothetical protein
VKWRGKDLGIWADYEKFGGWFASEGRKVRFKRNNGANQAEPTALTLLNGVPTSN